MNNKSMECHLESTVQNQFVKLFKTHTCKYLYTMYIDQSGCKMACLKIFKPM